MQELLRVPAPSPSIMALFVTGIMMASFMPYEVSNLAFANFSRAFTADEHSVLGLSLGFAPSRSWNPDDLAEVHVAHTRMMRGLYLLIFRGATWCLRWLESQFIAMVANHITFRRQNGTRCSEKGTAIPRHYGIW